MTLPSDPIRLAVNAMATRFELVIHGDEGARLRAAGEEALREVESLDRQLSLYRHESDIALINAHAGKSAVRVEPLLFRLLARALELSEATDGAFDVTIAPLMRAWGLAGGSGRIPSESELESALAKVGMCHMLLDESSFSVALDASGVGIDLGAIGKGYAIDRAVDILRENGATSALIHGGTSTIYALGAPPDADAWRVAVYDPITEAGLPEALDLRDCSLSVSAVHGKSFCESGREYGHVIDARTGLPTTAARLAAVWGPSAMETDALSTAMLVLGEPGLELLRERFLECRGRIVR